MSDVEAKSVVPIRFEVQPAGSRLSLFGERGLVAGGSTDEQGVFEAKLVPGRYELEVQHDGYQLLSQALDVTEAATQRLELTPLRGGLSIFTTPGALVQAKGASGTFELGAANEKGELFYDRLVEGTYGLVLTHPDHFEATAQAEIRKDRPAQVRQFLKGKPGSAYISASPQAAVWVDGLEKGKTGELLPDLVPGLRKFEVV